MTEEFQKKSEEIKTGRERDPRRGRKRDGSADSLASIHTVVLGDTDDEDESGVELLDSPIVTPR